LSKNPKAFRSISEAADEVGVPQHVLRFWETKFEFITPVKRAGGRRFYRPDDIETLQTVRRLLHDDGLTIKGVQRLFKDKGRAPLATLASGAAVQGASTTVSDSVVSKASALNFDQLEMVLAQIEAAQGHLETVMRR